LLSLPFLEATCCATGPGLNLIVLISARSIKQHDQNNAADTILVDARHFDVRSLYFRRLSINSKPRADWLSAFILEGGLRNYRST